MSKLGKAELKMKANMHHLYRDSDSPMMCEYCKGHMGVWHMLRRSIKVKKGELYTVHCKRCGKDNILKKGEIAKHIKELDKRWEG